MYCNTTCICSAASPIECYYSDNCGVLRWAMYAEDPLTPTKPSREQILQKDEEFATPEKVLRLGYFCLLSRYWSPLPKGRRGEVL